MKNILFTCILFLGFGLTTSAAQSKKMKEKVTELVEKLNAEIMAGDKSQSLTEIQKDILTRIQIKRLTELKAVKKEDGDKADLKEINKKYFKQINKEVLTKKQRQAKKKGKDEMKQ